MRRSRALDLTTVDVGRSGLSLSKGVVSTG